MKEAYQNLECVMKELYQEGAFPGATYAVTNGIESYKGVVGKKSYFPEVEDNQLNTLYDQASLSKVIVTNTILTRALQAGKVNLTDQVGIYLPEFAHFNFTLYHLATHTSGLPADFDIQNIHSNEDFEKQLYAFTLAYKTGTDVIYSDPGFIILGMVLETVYGKSLDLIANEEVFEPLHMTHSTYYPDPILCAPTELTKERGIVRGKTHDEKGYYADHVVGHAGLFSDIEDVTKFVNMILNDGFVDGKVYLQKEYLDMWFYPYVQDKEGTKRSIGWIVGEYGNVTGSKVSEQTIHHAGFTGTSIVIDKKCKVAVIALTNRVHPTRENRLLVTSRKRMMDAVIERTKRKI